MKAKQAMLLKADGTNEWVSPANGKKFTLEELQKFVGGWIEMVPVSEKMVMVVNEEGTFHQLPYNKTATRLWQESFKPNVITGSIICGDVLVGKGIF